MPQLKPLEITPRQLAQLSASEAVDILRELIWAEAARSGIGKNLISVPTAVTVSDGGIDAEISAAPTAGSQGIFKQGLTRYQVKTGDFSVSESSNVRNILCKPRHGNNPRELNTRVKSCLDQRGTLIVVLFGWDLPDRTDSESVQKFRDELVEFDPNYRDASIEIWGQSKIIGFLSPFPSLRLHLLGGRSLPFSTFDMWNTFADMRSEWHPGKEQLDFVDAIGEQLRSDSGPVEVRVIGDPGIGKTRAVMEALRPNDLSPLVLYCDSPKGVLESDLVGHMLMSNTEVNAILVVDECDYPSKADIWNRLESVSPRVKLVSIHNEPDPSRGANGYLDPQPLAAGNIVEIVAGYGFPIPDVRRFVEFCDGSPRVAHVIGQNLLRNPDDLTRPLNTVDVWNRFIADREPLDGTKHRERKKVLLWLSLFKRFGYERPYQVEAEQIAAKIEEIEGLPRGEFDRIVRDLRKRKLLQGQTTLYITPRLFHIWLWNEWWDMHKGTFDLEAFRIIGAKTHAPSVLSDNLLGWFHDMFRYATSSGTSKVVSDLLGPNGPFDIGYLDSPEGSRFFRSLSEADPRKALVSLKRALGGRNREDLLAFRNGRRSVVYTLELSAHWRDLFNDSARLLLALGAAENESWSNNASGVFTDLFSSAYGEGAPTEASMEERLPVLEEALSSDIGERRTLGIRAARKALETHGSFRIVSVNDSLLQRRLPAPWHPETWGEVFNGYRGAWQILTNSLDGLNAAERDAAVKALLESIRGLVRIANLADMVADTIELLGNKPYVDSRSLVETIESVLHYERKNLPPPTLARWEGLRRSLVGTDFQSRLKRYAGMALLEDNFDEAGNHVDQSSLRLGELARESLESPSLLLPELAWLVEGDAENGYLFGYQLGLHDVAAELLPALSRAQAEAPGGGNAFFLGGYFRALRERDVEQWDDELDRLCQDNALNAHVPELSWRSGDLTDRAADRILLLARVGVMPPGAFRLFTLGRALSNLSEGVFLSWSRYLSDIQEQGVQSILLNLFAAYYLHGNPKRALPYEETLTLLIHPLFFEDAEGVRDQTMDQHYWTKLAQRFISSFPESGNLLADKILENYGNDSAVTSGFHSEATKVLNDVTRREPEAVWNSVEKFIGPPLDVRAYHVGRWLHGEDLFDGSGQGALQMFPAELVWRWIDENVEQRAWYGAHIVPKELFHSADKICLARELLLRYGAREDVRTEMTANVFSGGWTGPASLHYEHVKREVADFGKEETNENVRLWVDEFTTYLDLVIQDAQAREERRGY